MPLSHSVRKSRTHAIIPSRQEEQEACRYTTLSGGAGGMPLSHPVRMSRDRMTVTAKAIALAYFFFFE